MPQTTLRSQTVLPVRVTSPACVRRRQTSPMVRRSRPTHVKDLADHAGFIRDNLIASLPAPLMLGDIAVAIGRPAQHIDRAGSGRVALAPAMAFDNLGALILGHHALHLQQQVVFRAAAQLPVQEDDFHPSR